MTLKHTGQRPEPVAADVKECKLKPATYGEPEAANQSQPVQAGETRVGTQGSESTHQYR